MTLLRKVIRIIETAAFLMRHRNIDYMIDVHIVGKVEGPGSIPIPEVGVFVLKTDQIPRDGSPQPLPFVGESRSDGSLDIKFKYMWGNKIGWWHKKKKRNTTFSLHFVHADFDTEVMQVAYGGATAQVVSRTNIILKRLSEDEAQKVRKTGSRSQYLRKRDPEPGDPGESWDPDKPWPHEAPFGGDTFSIEGNCGDQTQRIVDGVRWAYWQLRDGNIVTDPGLRVCIMQHMNNASLGCGGGGCDATVNGYNDDYLFFRSSHIVMCMGKVRNLSTTDIGRLAIHEWAHSCGWDHGDGKGVPGDSGVGLAEAVKPPNWQLLDNNQASIVVVANGNDLYQLHNNGLIWKLNGPPMTGWELFDNNPATKKIAAAGGNLYQMHQNGLIWKLTGPPMTGWQLFDNNPASVDIVADGSDLYQLHNNGLIWKLTGPPMTGWELFDNNPATKKIAAAGGNLYQMHQNGLIWKLAGPPMTGWQLLDNNPASVDIVAAGNNLYQIHGNGLIWKLIG